MHSHSTKTDLVQSIHDKIFKNRWRFCTFFVLVYCKPVVDGADASVFSTAIGKLKQHLQGALTLSVAQINEQAGLMASSMFTVINSEAALTEALAVLDLYEKKEGVFFVAAKTKAGFQNIPDSTDGFELARAVFSLQQGIFDHAFTPTNFAKYKSLLSATKFNTSDFYPGKVKIAADTGKTYTAKINASMPKYVGIRTAWSTSPALRPTGYYLAAGDVATVTVPLSMVNKGFTIRVGAHKQDKNGSNPVRRLFRISKTYPITSTSTEIALQILRRHLPVTVYRLWTAAFSECLKKLALI